MPQQIFEKFKIVPTVYLFADCDGLGLSIVEKLLSSFCKVVVVTPNIILWNQKTGLLKNNQNFRIIPLDSEIEDVELSYSIFVDVYLNRNKKEITKVIDVNKRILGKKFVLLPYQVDSLEQRKVVTEIKSELVGKDNEVEFFYVGDILGPNINKQSHVYLLVNLYRQGVIPKEESYLYPILSRDVVKNIAESIFSFGPTTNEIALIGKPVQIDSLISFMVNNKYFDANMTNSILFKRIFCGNIIENVFSINLNLAYKETLDWLQKNTKIENLSFEKIKEVKKTNDIIFPKINFDLKIGKIHKPTIKGFPKINLGKPHIFYGLLLSVLILVIPLIIMLFSVSLFIVSLNSIEKGQKSMSLILSNLSSNTSFLSEKTLNIYSDIPVLGNIYNGPSQIAGLIKDGNEIGERALNIYSITNDLPQKILGNDLYSVSDITNEIFLEIDSLHKDVSFLISELDSLSPSLNKTVYKYISKDRINSIKETLLALKNITYYLDEILGAKEKKTYLVLFQNNMELRPTGGFIGSFALITFDGGRVTEINVQDVYSADGQLKGHVEPPIPVRKYLGEAGWFLRDANWDPDFSVSSNKIEWFLEKEIDQKVDGVFAINLEVVKELLKVVGPINILDYGIVVNSENVYEVTQTEVEDSFFPGSRKKSNYLTALSKELLNVLINNKENNFKIAKVLINGLEEKHIQLSFHNQKIQKEIININYDGGVSTKHCNGNCFYNFASYIDANVGVNKANYFMERSAKLNVFINENKITNSLIVTFKNNGNPLLGDKVRYKSYVRALALPGSEFSDIKIIEFGQENIISPEIEVKPNYKEAGTLLIVNPGEEKSVEFMWTNNISQDLDFSVGGEYGTYFRKQAGTLNDRLTINLFLPNYAVVKTDNPFFSLTSNGSYVYNTLLTRDVFPLIYW